MLKKVRPGSSPDDVVTPLGALCAVSVAVSANSVAKPYDPSESTRPLRAPRKLKKVRFGTLQCEVGVSSFAADFTETATETARKRRLVETHSPREFRRNSFFLENPLWTRQEHPERLLPKKSSSGLVGDDVVTPLGALRAVSVAFSVEIRGKAVRDVQVDAAFPRRSPRADATSSGLRRLAPAS